MSLLRRFRQPMLTHKLSSVNDLIYIANVSSESFDSTIFA